MERLIQEIQGLTQRSKDEVELLLVSFNWNKEKFITQYFGDMVKVLRQAGIIDQQLELEEKALKEKEKQKSSLKSLKGKQGKGKLKEILAEKVKDTEEINTKLVKDSDLI
ncbi:MAG: hypothetical protein EZS28_054789, partial [Streblomastix strix]